MPSITIMPYEFADDMLMLELKDVVLDGNSLCTSLKAPEDISLIKEIGWKKVEFDLEVSAGPAPDFTGLASDLVDVAHDVQIAVLVQDMSAKFRRGVSLTFDATRKLWKGRLVFGSQDHFGPLELIPVAVRASERAPVSGEASRAGEKVASGSSVRFLIHESAPFPGKAMDAQWRDFEADPNLKDQADSSYFLDLRDVNKPELLMNDSIKGLRSILQLSSTRGRNARFRDVLAASILNPVLVELCLVALSHNGPSALEDLDGWRKGVLLDLAKRSRSMTQEAQVKSWLERWGGNEKGAVLSEIGNLVQRKLGTRTAFEKLISESQNLGNENGESHD